MRMATKQQEGDWLSNLLGRDLTVNGWQVDIAVPANDDEEFDFEDAMEWLDLKGLKIR
ncbi:hypothetical protein [Aestuariispira insulae]|uniref:Uncharacterized protein n=1 Tax=Aestuariispira insulae TaxID=1461337 RepID=A0A3D9HJN9_9PROT|nr:hypothetical protein [Aestuariispira insulae]RED49136.1 hypothetical protein DFP90_106113 [Aestuariispira insulae]